MAASSKPCMGLLFSASPDESGNTQLAVSIMSREDVAGAVEDELQAFAQLVGMEGVRTLSDDDYDPEQPVAANVTTFKNEHRFWAVWIADTGPVVLENLSLDAEAGYSTLTNKPPKVQYTDEDFF
jgi:hypothetical protein